MTEPAPTPLPILVRFAYLSDCTLGWLSHGPLRLATIERPWIPDPRGRPGGKPRASCVPDGAYALYSHSGGRFKNVFGLAAPALGVYRQPSGRPHGDGRSAILIHTGNTVTDVVGCVAIGLSHGEIEGRRAVLSSREALSRLREAWAYLPPKLLIRPTRGTGEEQGNPDA